MSFKQFTVLLVLAIIHFVNASFECDVATKQCICTHQSCNHICTDDQQCKNYEFSCSNQSHSCSISCLHKNACKNTQFYLNSSFSIVKCISIGSCTNVLFECISENDCILESHELSFKQSQFICNGVDEHTNECSFNVLNDTYSYGILACLFNNSMNNIKCTIKNKKIQCLPSNECDILNNNNNVCIGPLCNIDSYLQALPDINIPTSDDYYSSITKTNNKIECNNNIFDNDITIWILTIICIISTSISCILFYYCYHHIFTNNYENKKELNGIEIDLNEKDIKSDDIINKNGCSEHKQELELNVRKEEESEVETMTGGETVEGVKVFETSFWLTILSTLFNDDDKTDGIDCGIILIPNGIDCNIILNRLECIQCRVPVTEQFLKHYGRTSKKPNSYILIQNGYIYAYEIYNTKNNVLYNMNMNATTIIIIDSHKKTTQKNNNSYYRIFVDNLRVKSADQFCSVLMNQHGIDINLKTDDTTTTWKLRESLELSSSFFETKAEGIGATNLANSLHYLQERRTHRTNAEMVGATIVVIPYNKTLADYKLYLRQYLSVSMEVSDSSLFCIFSHHSVLHDGAIFVRGNTIIAVKAFFRITGQYKNKVSIGHGTRHASAQEFSKHAKIHNPITFVLSEEDGQIRSCIAGEIKKINYRFIGRLVVEHHHSHQLNEGKSNKSNKKSSSITNTKSTKSKSIITVKLKSPPSNV